MPAYNSVDVPTLLGPAPCDSCRHWQRCGVSGEACIAFREYCRGVKEHRWRLMPKQPREDIGRRMGFEQRRAPEVRAVMPWERERLTGVKSGW